MSNFGDIEDDTDILADPPGQSPLDVIRAIQDELKTAAIRTVKLRDPSQPEYELVCEVPTDTSDILRIRKRAEEVAKSPNAPESAVVGTCMILARYTRQLRVRGKDSTGDSEGSVFADPKVQKSIGAPNAWRAVRQLFIVPGGGFDDGVTDRMVVALLEKGGLGSDTNVVVDEAQDPT